MFETSEEGGNLAQMRLIWYQKSPANPDWCRGAI